MNVYEQKLALEVKWLELEQTLKTEEANNTQVAIETLEDEIVDIQWLNRTLYAA